MVLGEQHLPLVLELFPDQLRDPELFLQPYRHRLGKGTEPSRETGKVRGEEPLEFQERLVVEPHVVQILRCDLSRLQAVLDGLAGKPLIVLLSREAPLGGGCDQATVLNETGGGIVIVAGDTKDVHDSTSFRTVSDILPSFPGSAPSRPRRSPATSARVSDPCGTISAAGK